MIQGGRQCDLNPQNKFLSRFAKFIALKNFVLYSSIVAMCR